MGSVSLVTGGVGELVSQLDGGLVGWSVPQLVGQSNFLSVGGQVSPLVVWSANHWVGHSCYM